MHLDGTGTQTLEARLLESAFRGSICRIVVEKAGFKMTFDFLSRVDLPPVNSIIRLSFFPEEAIQVLPSENG
jgi:hypothetical protein